MASANKAETLYIIVDEDVYDVTKFQDEHPGMFCIAPLVPHWPRLTIPQVGRRVSTNRATQWQDCSHSNERRQSYSE